MKRRFFIYATNIHQGGGRSLLEAIMEALPRGIEVILSLDERMPLLVNTNEDVQLRRVKPTIMHRLKEEIWLVNTVLSEDFVMCFGNLPPVIKLRGRVLVFVQNRYLVDDVKVGDFPLKTRLRLAVERTWLRKRLKNVDEFIVQTPSMRTLLDLVTKGIVPVRVLPFMSSHEYYVRSELQEKVEKKSVFDFFYVASGEPHKNHKQLIDAWCILAKEGLLPSLKLTVDKTHFRVLCNWIELKVSQHRLNVENLGNIKSTHVKQLYGLSSAMIYPSNFESFGLPLIEARQEGIPVLASELDFVRDVLDPEQTFDPNSPVSIARAVKRFMGVAEKPLPLLNASEFLVSILQKEIQ